MTGADDIDTLDLSLPEPVGRGRVSPKTSNNTSWSNTMPSTSEIVSFIVEMQRQHRQDEIGVVNERFPDTKWDDRIRAFIIAVSIADGAAKIADLDDYMIERSTDPDIIAWREWDPHHRRQAIIDDLKTGL